MSRPASRTRVIGRTRNTRRSETVVRNLLPRRGGGGHTLVARHAVGLGSGEIFVVSTEARPAGGFLTTTTLLYWAAIRRAAHPTRHQAIADHSNEIRRLLATAHELAYGAAAG